jgi:hypothetical protein
MSPGLRDSPVDLGQNPFVVMVTGRTMGPPKPRFEEVPAWLKVIHVEVTGKDGPKLQKFYSDIFGWNLDTNNRAATGYRQEDGLTGIGAAQDGGAAT